MKVIFVALAFVAVAAAAAIDPKNPETVSASFDKNPDGSYISKFETENGIISQEEGQFKDVVNEKKEHVNVLVVRGSYSYINPNGEVQSISYVADENGFQPEGSSIPKNSS